MGVSKTFVIMNRALWSSIPVCWADIGTSGGETDECGADFAPRIPDAPGEQRHRM
jgi:hypothetical protein